MIRKYRDYKLQVIQAQSIKEATTRKLHRHIAMKTTDKSVRSHKEEAKGDYRDALNPRMDEYQREARTLMISMHADKGEQIETTEKLILELSQVLQQFSLKVHEQESVSILSKKNKGIIVQFRKMLKSLLSMQLKEIKSCKKHCSIKVGVEGYLQGYSSHSQLFYGYGIGGTPNTINDIIN